MKKKKEKFKIKLNKEFRPAPQLRKLYYIYLLLGTIFTVLCWYLPILLSSPWDKGKFWITIIILAILIFIIYWIPKYYNTIVYKLTKDEIVWKRGVWFKKTGIVPYNRITNIDITQNPISRMLGIASLRIQTAGYSGQKSRAEIRIEGIKRFEELKDLIIELVKGKRPVAVETYEREGADSKILNELVKIRKLLEKSLKK